MLALGSFRQSSEPSVRSNPFAASGQRIWTGAVTLPRRSSTWNRRRFRKNPKIACSAPYCWAQVARRLMVSSVTFSGFEKPRRVSQFLMNGAREIWLRYKKRFSMGRLLGIPIALRWSDERNVVGINKTKRETSSGCRDARRSAIWQVSPLATRATGRFVRS